MIEAGIIFMFGAMIGFGVGFVSGMWAAKSLRSNDEKK